MVADDQPPLILNCPSDIQNDTQQDRNGSVVTWPDINVDENDVYTLTSTYTSGDFFEVGTTTVVVSVVDSSNLNDTCEFIVNITGRC